MTIVLFAQKALAWIKKYWQYLVMALSAVLSVVIFRKRDDSYADDLKKINDAHQKELHDIELAREEEHRKNVENEKRLSEALAHVQRQYDDAKKNLDDKKRKEIEDIVRKYANDPDELAKQLSAATGFSVVLPTE